MLANTVRRAQMSCAAGDRGFDPLRLGADPDALAWYKEGELTNGRWAMMAVAGILFTDAIGLPKFWLAGAEVRPQLRHAHVV